MSSIMLEDKIDGRSLYSTNWCSWLSIDSKVIHTLCFCWPVRSARPGRRGGGVLIIVWYKAQHSGSSSAKIFPWSSVAVLTRWNVCLIPGGCFCLHWALTDPTWLWSKHKYTIQEENRALACTWTEPPGFKNVTSHMKSWSELMFDNQNSTIIQKRVFNL